MSMPPYTPPPQQQAPSLQSRGQVGIAAVPDKLYRHPDAPSTKERSEHSPQVFPLFKIVGFCFRKLFEYFVRSFMLVFSIIRILFGSPQPPAKEKKRKSYKQRKS